ncbi:CamS family sex pheromone protein [Ligilactobacillus apodemi]|uniref:CamS family sex pheromone protein n=1 Tax=Ligilactobacillus apodemi TaxID=307126 RepID=UPI00214BB7F9|nr:CamS family sex pheromone protein [Ligilactobacillus apodemi]
MKKKYLALISLCMGSLFLTACGNLNSSSTSSTTTTTQSSSSGYQTTGQSSDSEYQSVIQNGSYLTSKARGVGITQNSENMLNLKAFESGLTTLSKTEFSPKDYIFREGQLLSKSTVQKWLSRKSSSNPTGLNPKDNGETDADKRNPIYVQQIEEQDYMKEENGKLVLAGITIGIGMNRKDYYQKEEYGATYTTTISKAKMIAEGKKAAAEVLKRVRKLKGASDIPIMICMFEQAPNDSLVGGTFYAYNISKSSTLGTWKSTNLQSSVLPTTSESTAINDNDESSFTSFKNKIQNFFPNLAGVTATTKYKNKSLQELHVKITTQFYSETEIRSFTQYVAQAAKTYLPSGIPIDITIKGSDGDIQAFIARESDSSSYYTHVFDD